MFQCSHFLYKLLMLFESCIAPRCTLLSCEFYRLAACCEERKYFLSSAAPFPFANAPLSSAITE